MSVRREWIEINRDSVLFEIEWKGTGQLRIGYFLPFMAVTRKRRKREYEFCIDD